MNKRLFNGLAMALTMAVAALVAWLLLGKAAGLAAALLGAAFVVMNVALPLWEVPAQLRVSLRERRAIMQARDSDDSDFIEVGSPFLESRDRDQILDPKSGLTRGQYQDLLALYRRPRLPVGRVKPSIRYVLVGFPHLFGLNISPPHRTPARERVRRGH